MVHKLRDCPSLIISYAKARYLQKTGSVWYCQRKHLSAMVPFQSKVGLIRQKTEELVKWYDEFTGMDEVRNAQKRVLEDEEIFRKTQDERRKIVNQLTEIQNKMKDLYAELDTTNRGDEKYLHLVTEEHKLLKEEKIIMHRFSAAEKHERDAFTALSASVKLSHEKERAQSERTKYWSIIGSVIGTVIGILGTSINNHFKMKELKELIKTSSNKKLIDNLNDFLVSNEKLFAQLKENENVIQKNTDVTVTDVLDKLNSRLDNVEVTLNNLEKNSKDSKFKTESFVIKNIKDAEPVITVAEAMKKEFTQTKMLLYALAILTIFMPLISKNS